MPSESEKRANERKGADTPVSFNVPGTDVTGTARIGDTSDTGIQLLAECKIEPGTLVAVRIPRGGELPPYVTMVRVVRCESKKGEFAMGCALD